MPKKDRTKSHEVRNLITMLGSAVIIACIGVIGFVYYFGHSGTYLLKDLLISPETLEKIQTSGRQEHFIFNKTEFTRADASGKGWGRFGVSQEAYSEFYTLAGDVRSIPKISDEMTWQFQTVAPSTLTVFFQEMNSSEVFFQQIQFLDQGDLFRVNSPYLHKKEENGENWVYFNYPKIYQKVIELFLPTSSNH